MKASKLSVVIPVFNAAGTIAEQLVALTEQCCDESWEIVVVNNRCTDDTLKIVARYVDRLPGLRIVNAFAKQGAAYAMNAGVRAAQADTLAFCDADDVVSRGWVAAMGEGLQKYPFVSGPLEIQRLNHVPLTLNRPNSQATGIQQYNYPPFLPHAGAGNMGVHRKHFEAVGGFDESLRTLFETDFCWKMQLRGIPLTPLGNAIVHVRRRARARELLQQARRYAECDVLLYKRYRPLGMPKLSKKTGIKAWLDLIVGIPALTRDETRARYLWDLGWRTGRLQASIRHRVWAL